MGPGKTEDELKLAVDHFGDSGGGERVLEAGPSL